MDKIKLQRDYGAEYEPTDSENDYSDGEKELLKEVRKGRKKDESSKREILAFTDSEQEEDNEADNAQDDDDDMGLADSDIEGAEQNDDDLPDTKYWGKKSSAYYNTDFVDQDYSTYNEKEEELAKLEEIEAKAIQLRLAKHLKEADFALDTPLGKLKKKAKASEDDESLLKGKQLKADFSGLSKRERMQLFEKDSPEFAGLIGDFEGYIEEIQQLHAPVLRYVQEKKVPMIPALQFAQLYQNIALTYCSNLSFYLLLKSHRISIQNHPIIARLTQLKKLLGQLDDKHENIVKPQLEALLERIQDGDEFEVLEMKTVGKTKREGETDVKKSKKSKLGIMSAFDGGEEKNNGLKKPKQMADNLDTDLDALARMNSDEDDDDDDENDDENNEMNADEEELDENGESRRGITYQIAKNKGLTPHRKKEQRNPRVKHRGKYRKALIRRKGAVRTARKELSRYGGEISGIKATVSKSVKFKS